MALRQPLRSDAFTSARSWKAEPSCCLSTDPGTGHRRLAARKTGFLTGKLTPLLAYGRVESSGAIIVRPFFSAVSVAAAFAVNHPEKVIGLCVSIARCFILERRCCPVYNRVAQVPVLGWVYSGVIVPPIGLTQMDFRDKERSLH